MFNINAFNPIPSGPIGNCGVGILEGPGTSTIAAGLSKTFHLTERMRLRFEDTFTNLMNHPNFAPPPTTNKRLYGKPQALHFRNSRTSKKEEALVAVCN